MNAVLAITDSHVAWLEPLFDVAFDAPGGITRLRQLVLTLAIQGKLVRQDPKDVPASELIKQIAMEKSALTKGGKLRAPRLFAPISKAEELYAIPVNWEWVKLDQLKPEFQNGLAKRRASSGKETIVLRLADVSRSQISLVEPRQIKLTDVERKKYSLAKDDILITRVNGSTNIVGSFTACSALEGCVAYCDHFIRMRIRPDVVCIDFLNQVSRTRAVRSQIEKMFVTTAGQKTVNQNHISSLVVPLPPLEEQKRIVARIDQLMSLCDELDHMRQQQADRRSATRSAVLRQWIAGDASSAELLCKDFVTLVSTREDVAELRKTILQLTVMGKLVAHTDSIPSVALKEITSKIGSGATPAGGKEAYQKSGIPLIRSMNVHFDGFRREGLAFINDTQAANLRNVVVQAGDVLLNITGASIGRVTIAPAELEGARVNQHVCIIRPVEKVDARYLQACLASPFTQERIFDVQLGATREALTKGMIETFPIPLPPLKVQKRIVARMDQLMQLCEALERNIDAAQAKQTELLESVMARI